MIKKLTLFLSLVTLLSVASSQCFDLQNIFSDKRVPAVMASGLFLTAAGAYTIAARSILRIPFAILILLAGQTQVIFPEKYLEYIDNKLENGGKIVSTLKKIPKIFKSVIQETETKKK